MVSGVRLGVGGRGGVRLQPRGHQPIAVLLRGHEHLTAHVAALLGARRLVRVRVRVRVRVTSWCPVPGNVGSRQVSQ